MTAEYGQRRAGGADYLRANHAWPSASPSLPVSRTSLARRMSPGSQQLGPPAAGLAAQAISRPGVAQRTRPGVQRLALPAAGVTGPRAAPTSAAQRTWPGVQRLALPAADVAGLATAAVMAGRPVLPSALYALAVLAMLASGGLQRLRICLRVADQAGRIVMSVALPLLVVLPWLTSGAAERLALGSAALVLTCRAAVCAALRAAHRRGALTESALIVGTGTTGAAIGRALLDHPEFGLRPAGFLAGGGAQAGQPDHGLPLPVIGSTADLADIAVRLGIRRVIVCPAGLRRTEQPDQPGQSGEPARAACAGRTHEAARTACAGQTHEPAHAARPGQAPEPAPPRQADGPGPAELAAVLRACESLRADVCVAHAPSPAGGIVPSASLDEIWGIPLVPYRPLASSPGGRRLKRAFDVAIALPCLAVALPLLALLAAAIRLESGRPPIFRQVRVTRDGRLAVILKLRTLTEHDDPDTSWTVPAYRSTRLGRWLRATHVDELPQLVNVLRGEMSLSRPAARAPHFAGRFASEIPGYRDRTRMPAGLTGWAQVHGLHGDTSIDERVRFDNSYIDSWSPWLDLVILARTAGTFRHRNRASR